MKDEMKNKISMALKDPILQQGFECICKENAELKLKLEALEGQIPWKDIKGKSEVIGKLTEAKEIIGNLLGLLPDEVLYHDFYNRTYVAPAEQFLKEEYKMFNLNEMCVIAYENAKKREAKDGKVSTDTRLMLKHTATEVVEAAEAYNSMVDRVANKEIFASELADIVCCVLIIAGKEDIDMDKALADCMEKNYKRAIGKGDK